MAQIDLKGGAFQGSIVTATLTANRTYTLPDDDATLTTSAGVPSGCILMWSGAISAIPSGWVICDGNNSTPNLSSRFVIHADADSGGTYDVNDTGGSTTTGAHTLTIAEMPAHSHNRQHGFDGDSEAANQSSRDNRNNATTLASTSTGGGGSHTHGSTIPPYFALAYIMKT